MAGIRFRENSSILALSMNGLYQKIAWTLIPLGFLGFNITLFLLRLTDLFIGLFFILSIISILIGGVFLVVRRNIYFDARSRSVSGPAGFVLDFNRIRGISLYTEQQVYSINGQRVEQSVFCLGLVLKEEDAGAGAARLYKLFQTRRLARAWNFALTIAKFINVPLLDMIRDTPVELLPDEFGLPVGVRMQKRRETIEKPEGSPDKMSMEESGDSLRLVWRVSKLPGIVTFLVVGLLLVGFGILLQTLLPSGVPQWIFMIWAGPGLLFLSAVIALLKGHGKNELFIDGKTLSYTTFLPKKNTQSILLKDLKYFSPHPQLGTILVFLSEEKTINCVVRKDHQLWLYRRIGNFIFGKPAFD